MSELSGKNFRLDFVYSFRASRKRGKLTLPFRTLKYSPPSPASEESDCVLPRPRMTLRLMSGKLQTVVLCGGRGTRIRDVSADTVPKPMVPIGGKPILWHILSHYRKFGHGEFILCLGHLSWMIKQYFVNYRSMVSDFSLNLLAEELTYHTADFVPDWKLIFAETGEETMTAGRIRQIAKYLRGDHFFLTYGDGLADVDLDALLKFHLTHKKMVTLTGVLPPGRFGELKVLDGAVTSLKEKPQASDRFINGGFMVCRRELAAEFLRDVGDDVMLEREPLESLAADGELMMYRHDGFWQCMDTHRDWELLNQLARKGELP